MATVGTLLVFATVMSNVSLAKAALLSVAVTVTETMPTSALAGVPLKVCVAASKLNQLGRPLAEYVSASPTSTSANVLAAKEKLNGLSSLAG